MTAQDLSNTQILVVDDNAMNRELLRQELEDAGYQVATAADGNECLNVVDRNPPQLIVLDIQMPGMSGLEVVAKVRLKHPRTRMPIIMATADSASATMVAALTLGANDYVTKPIDIDALVARIQGNLAMRTEVKAEADGAFHTLADGIVPEATSSRWWCESCRVTQPGRNAECIECGEHRPEFGWPKIPTDRYPHLGNTVANRYYLDKPLGIGAQGSVYRARSVDLGRHFAVKVVDFASLQDVIDPDEVRDTVRKEIEALAALRNPHVVQIFEIVRIDKTVYGIVTEFIPGRSMQDLMRGSGKLPAVIALDVTRQLAQALHAVHELGLVHCDLKPANVMLEPLPGNRFHAKLLDFGIVRQTEGTRGPGTFAGTPRYASPEQIQGIEVLTPKSDIYSLGCMLYQMVSGAPPFRTDDKGNIFFHHMKTPVPLIERPDLPRDVLAKINAIIRLAMHKAPVDRFGSAGDMLEQIEIALSDLRVHLRKENFADPDAATLKFDGELESVLPTDDKHAEPETEPAADELPVTLMLAVAAGVGFVLFAGAILAVLLASG